MLPKSARIPKSLFTELERVQRGKTSPYFTMKVAVVDGKHSQVAVSVSKKVSKSAVQRNTLRRRVYAVLERNLSDLSPGLYLFIAKPQARDLRGQKLNEEISLLLKTSLKR